MSLACNKMPTLAHRLHLSRLRPMANGLSITTSVQNGELCEADLNWELIKTTKILHIAGALVMPRFDGAPMANVLREAKRLGITTALDTAYDATGKWMETLEPCLPHVDIFMPSIVEAQQLTGMSECREIAQFFRNTYNIQTIAIKMGGKRQLYFHTRKQNSLYLHIRSMLLTQPVQGMLMLLGFSLGLLWVGTWKRLRNWHPRRVQPASLLSGLLRGIQNLEETLKISGGSNIF